MCVNPKPLRSKDRAHGIIRQGPGAIRDREADDNFIRLISPSMPWPGRHTSEKHAALSEQFRAPEN